MTINSIAHDALKTGQLLVVLATVLIFSAGCETTSVRPASSFGRFWDPPTEYNDRSRPASIVKFAQDDKFGRHMSVSISPEELKDLIRDSDVTTVERGSVSLSSSSGKLATIGLSTPVDISVELQQQQAKIERVSSVKAEIFEITTTDFVNNFGKLPKWYQESVADALKHPNARNSVLHRVIVVTNATYYVRVKGDVSSFIASIKPRIEEIGGTVNFGREVGKIEEVAVVIPEGQRRVISATSWVKDDFTPRQQSLLGLDRP